MFTCMGSKWIVQFIDSIWHSLAYYKKTTVYWNTIGKFLLYNYGIHKINTPPWLTDVLLHFPPLQLTSSLSVLLLLCLLSHILTPPRSLPDIFPVLISCYSCFLFLITLSYLVYIQLSLPRVNEKNLLWDCDIRSYNNILYQIVGRSNINLNIDSHSKSK